MAVDYQYLKPSLGLTDYPTAINTLIDLLQLADQEVETARGSELTLNDRFDTIESSITIGSPTLNNLVAMDASGSLIDSGFLASQFIRSDNVSDTALGSITFSNIIDITGNFNINSVTVNSSAAELNYLNISVLGTGAINKAVVLDNNGDYTWPNTGILTYGVLHDGTTALTANVAELNTMQGILANTSELNIMDGVTATFSEINLLAGYPAALPRFNTSQEWSAQQNFNAVTVTYASPNTDWNVNVAQVGILTLNGDTILNNPTNFRAGSTYILIVKQDSTGGYDITSYGGNFKWAFGSTPVLGQDPNAINVLSFVSDGTSLLGTWIGSYV